LDITAAPPGWTASLPRHPSPGLATSTPSATVQGGAWTKRRRSPRAEKIRSYMRRSSPRTIWCPIVNATRSFAANWSSKDNRGRSIATGTTPMTARSGSPRISCGVPGLLRHSRGTPALGTGFESFKGRIVHPQTGPTTLLQKRQARRQFIGFGWPPRRRPLLPAIRQTTLRPRDGWRQARRRFPAGRNAIALAEGLRGSASRKNGSTNSSAGRACMRGDLFTQRSFHETEKV